MGLVLIKFIIKSGVFLQKNGLVAKQLTHHLRSGG